MLSSNVVYSRPMKQLSTFSNPYMEKRHKFTVYQKTWLANKERVANAQMEQNASTLEASIFESRKSICKFQLVVYSRVKNHLQVQVSTDDVSQLRDKYEVANEFQEIKAF